jgi:membrane associated rhomboid family serine protease
MEAVPVGETLQRLVFVAVTLTALAAVWWLDRSTRGRSPALRRRLLLGVPWGTLVTAVGVLAVYLFVQDGSSRWQAPVVLPFRAWSYGYPLGMLAAAFSHTGPGHLVGNLVGTLTLAPLAEYAVGHFPRRRGEHTFSSPWTNPYVRAFLLFPAAVVGVGLLSAAFALGPVIGFSGVVFAFAGFALVYYPLATVVAVAAGRVLRVGYSALLQPTTTASARQVFTSPWWADIAIQGHALGLLTGVLLGLYVSRRRGDARPAPLRLWLGVVLFAVAESMWAVYWFRGNGSFVLFRAIGMALVVLLATVVVLGVRGSDRPLFPAANRDGLRSVTRWQVGAIVLLLSTAALAGPAVPYNVVGPADEPLDGQTLAVRDYEVTYAENVENGLTSSFDIDLFGESTTVRTSGVIVQSRSRSIWTTAVSKRRLAFAGTQRVRLGGVGWRDSVVVQRRGWDLAGGNTTYRVTLTRDDETITAYRSSPARAEPVIAGRRVEIVPSTGGFVLLSTYGTAQESTAVPAINRSVTLQEVTFVHRETGLYAEYDQTRVRIARPETYHNR